MLYVVATNDGVFQFQDKSDEIRVSRRLKLLEKRLSWVFRACAEGNKYY
jgi:hypothetical protein